MHGAGFAEEAGAKFFEDGSDGSEDLPETVGVDGVVGGVSYVESEADGAGNFDGHVPNSCIDVERVEFGHERIVECGDGAWGEADRARFAEAGLDFESVFDEIEVDFEDPFLVGHRRCGEAAGGDIKRDVPRMIDPGRERHPDLAHNLRPHVEGRTGVTPVCVFERRPNLIA